MKAQFLAHIQSEENRIQTIHEHLHNTAFLAGRFGAVFEAEESAYNAGLLHDIGKYSDEFQKRIRGASIHTDHSTFGAQTAAKMKLLHEAFVIAGHHSGIPDFGTRMDGDTDSTLSGRLKRQVPDASSFQEEINTSEIRKSCMKFRSTLDEEFYIRMLYSCLVDADYLDTEAFMNGKEREYAYDTIDDLYGRLKEYVSGWRQSNDSELNRIRQKVQKMCFEKGSSDAKGLYTLTVPTGGGKTVSSLAYALSMAKEKKMDRIIYVIPYTSIIDQTAGVFSRILGEKNVLEHHSGVLYQFNETGDLDEEKYRKLLASENWDCPVVVTTSVQFFESLFSNRPSACRKLHNIANSVIVLDEAQNIPYHELKPCVYAISQLVKNYGCTALLCTATQPFLDRILSESDFMGNNYSVPEINDSPGLMYQALKRNTVSYLGITEIDEIVERMCSVRQSLCVVNTRASAQELYSSLPEGSSYCLTTLICAKHRKKMISEIKEKLQNGETCRVVSTSLIEAGIDLDFQIGFRELAGLDSVIQTAGRCNREGRNSAGNSHVYVFEFNDREIPAILKRNADACRAVMKHHDDPSSLEAIEEYFRLYQTISGENEMDRKQILRKLKDGVDGRMYPFASVSSEFHLIETEMINIYVPYDDGKEIVEKLIRGDISKTLMRKANQYCIGVHPKQYEKLLRTGAVCCVDQNLNVLTDLKYYSEATGLSRDIETGIGVFV